MEDGEAEVPDDASGEVTEPAADPEPVVVTPFQPTIDSSGWEINWTGAGALALVVLVVVLAWGWLGGGSDDGLATADDPVSTTDAPPTTVARTTTTSTTQVTTTTVAPTTTAAGPRVIITGEVKPCQFGARCLTASFVIEGFDEHPGRFACIYPNSVSDFGFNDDDVIDACLTGDAGDTITIEVAGIRSATISEDDLDGTG